MSILVYIYTVRDPYLPRQSTIHTHTNPNENIKNSSTAKKGYSGTVVLCSQDSGLTPNGVTCGIGQAEVGGRQRRGRSECLWGAMG